MKSICLCLALVVALPALAAEEYAVWQGKRYVLAYNPAERPDGIRDADVLDALAHAAAVWAPCGVKIEFGGFTSRSPDKLDGVSVLGWQQDIPGLLALTLPQHLRRTLLDADIRLNRRLLTQTDRLRQVVAHEVGHGLGLFEHSTAPDSLMNEQQFVLQGLDQPSGQDMALCRQRYAWPSR